MIKNFLKNYPKFLNWNKNCLSNLKSKKQKEEKMVVKDIQKTEPDYEFTTIFDLIQTCDKYQYKFKNTIRNIYNIDEYYDLDEISELLEVYEKLLKSARSE